MDRLLTTKEVHAIFGLPVSSLKLWRHLGKGPLWRKIEGRVYYRLRDVERWIERVQVINGKA